MVSKDELTESLIQYKWNDLLSMFKTMGLLYQKDIYKNKHKGYVTGVKKQILIDFRMISDFPYFPYFLKYLKNKKKYIILRTLEICGSPEVRKYPKLINLTFFLIL